MYCFKHEETKKKTKRDTDKHNITRKVAARPRKHILSNLNCDKCCKSRSRRPYQQQYGYLSSVSVESSACTAVNCFYRCSRFARWIACTCYACFTSVLFVEKLLKVDVKAKLLLNRLKLWWKLPTLRNCCLTYWSIKNECKIYRSLKRI